MRELIDFWFSRPMPKRPEKLTKKYLFAILIDGLLFMILSPIILLDMIFAVAKEDFLSFFD